MARKKALVSKVVNPYMQKSYGWFGVDILKWTNPNFYIDQFLLNWVLAGLSKLPSGFITILGITLVLVDQYMPFCQGQYCDVAKQVVEFLHKLPIPDLTNTGLGTIVFGLVKKGYKIGVGDVQVSLLPPAKQ